MYMELREETATAELYLEQGHLTGDENFGPIFIIRSSRANNI